MTFVSSLEPKPLWSHFDTILTIPRASKDEERMRQHVLTAATRAGCDHTVDRAGNVVVRKPASPGHEAAPVTILQSHLDMVQEKNADVAFDFRTDAIVPRRNGEHLYATGTTLGSDNGIGVATMLAVMDSTDLVHGPLELLFTIDEETGLTGAAQLDADLLAGRRLINLDSEEEGILYVGCAGGGDMRLSLGLTPAGTSSEDRTVTVALRGLKGGHSGCDIHLQRGNAVCLLGRALWKALGHADGRPAFRLARLEGGSAHNAIPREAFATVVVGASDRTRVEEDIRAEFAEIRAQYRRADPDMVLAVNDAEPAKHVWDARTTATALRLILRLPHGVEAMSCDIPDLVETSSNVAKVKGANGSLVIATSSRSSVDAELDALRSRIQAIAELAGAAVDVGPAYPGWQPNLDSEILKVVKRVHARELGSPPKIKAIHAGLECGIIGRKIPGMDMISFGPVIEFPHSPDERVLIPSVDRFYRLLAATLSELA
jgi:dipeptidase D